MFKKMGMRREVVGLAVLQNEDTIRLQQLLLHDNIGKLGQLLEGIGRVGEDEVVLLTAGLKETEHIATDRDAHLGIKFFQTILNETVMVAVHLHAYHLLAATRDEFQRYASRSGEEVEGCSLLEIDILQQHVEDVLLGEVGSRTGLEGAGNLEMATFIFSCYDTHGDILIFVYNPFT